MANTEEWCTDTLSKLLNDDLRISTLNEIKDHLSGMSEREATQTAQLLELPLVFDCLNDSNQEQVDLACEVLSLCMEKLDIAATTSRYSIPLERALTHPNSGVKVMALDEIARITNCDQRNQLVCSICRTSIFANLLRCIGDEDLKVGSRAASIATKFARIDTSCILHPSNRQIVDDAMKLNEVVRLRFYEMFIQICSDSATAHRDIVQNGLLVPLLQEFDTTDVLLKLNVIELLSSLVQLDYGYAYLMEEGFIDRLFRMYGSTDDPLFQQLCAPGILKFYGHMAATKPQAAFKDYPHVINSIFANLLATDYTMLKASLEALAFISRGDKLTIDTFLGAEMRAALKAKGGSLQATTTEVKLLVLSWLEELLTCAVDASPGCAEVARTWFDSFSDTPMDVVASYARNPFEEFRTAGLKVLLALSNYNWGQERIRTNPAMIELLLDRTAEAHKSCKDLKYDIIRTIAEKDFGVFDADTMARFRKYLNEGAHFVQVATEVAVERGA